MLIVFVDLHPAVWEFCRQLNCRLIFKTYPIDRSISISLLIYRPSEARRRVVGRTIDRLTD